MPLLTAKSRRALRLSVAGLALATTWSAAAWAQLGPLQPAQPQMAPPSTTAASAGASGGSAMAIAAVVNEDVITVYDVQSRVQMFMATSGMENSPEMQRRLVPQVVQSLIDERLKLQEAKKLKIATTDAEVRNAVDLIEQNNNMQPGTFRRMMDEKGVDMTTLLSQIEADVAWLKVVRQELRRDVVVAPEEVKTVLARLTANQGKPENEVSEIFLPINVSTRDADVRQLAERLVQQARTGTPFAALAQQFSQSPTAAVGGDLGWVLRGEMGRGDRVMAAAE